MQEWLAAIHTRSTKLHLSSRTHNEDQIDLAEFDHNLMSMAISGS